jgi:hypothetical protein
MKPRQRLNLAILANEARNALDQLLAVRLRVLRHALRLSVMN